MVTIRYGMIRNTRTVCAAQICADAGMLFALLHNHDQWEGGARIFEKKKRTNKETNIQNTWNEIGSASHAIHIMIHIPKH